MIICDGCDRSFHFSPRRGHDRITLGEKKSRTSVAPVAVVSQDDVEKFSKILARWGQGAPAANAPRRQGPEASRLVSILSDAFQLVSERLRTSQNVSEPRIALVVSAAQSTSQSVSIRFNP